MVFEWNGTQGAGHTRDVSLEGAFVVCSIPPNEGELIEIEVVFPGSTSDSPGFTIRSKGRVVRVESDPVTGFAASARLDRLSRRGRSG